MLTAPLNCSELQRDITAFADWSIKNGHTLNAAKCSVLTLSRSQINIDYEYRIGDTSINRNSSVKNLRIFFSDNFTFQDHLDSVYKKAVKDLKFIERTTFDFRHNSSIIYLYKIRVLPLLTYCSTIC